MGSVTFGSRGSNRITAIVKVAEAVGVKKGDVVFISGASGNNTLVKLADNRNHLSSHIVAIADQDGDLNDSITIVRAGVVEGFDTSAFSEEEPLLHLSINGGMQSAHPTVGTAVPVAYTKRSNAINGSVIVCIGQYVHDMSAASGQDLEMSLGDTAGVNKFIVKDYDNVELFHWNSNGEFVQGTDKVTVSAMAGAANGGLKVTIDGAGSVLTTGEKKVYIEADYDGTFTAARLFADQAGDVVVDIWKDTYVDFPPTVADTITAAAKPTLSGEQNSEDTGLSGWTKSFLKGDIFEINIDSVATITKLVISISADKTGE